jgi:hypothetical protein
VILNFNENIIGRNNIIEAYIKLSKSEACNKLLLEKLKLYNDYKLILNRKVGEHYTKISRITDTNRYNLKILMEKI